MKSLVVPLATAHSPESVGRGLHGRPGFILLRSGCFDHPHARYSMIAVEPFMVLRSFGTMCEVQRPGASIEAHFGNPWRLMEAFLARYELLDEIDLPFPLGGAMGFWGYDLRRFIEPRRQTVILKDLAVPDCHLGFYDSLLVFDHRTDQVFIVATGLQPDGTRNRTAALRAADRWRARLDRIPVTSPPPISARPDASAPAPESNFNRVQFCAAVERAQRYIRAGDIYQVNLAQRFNAPVASAWEHWQQMVSRSPAPFSMFMQGGDFQLASISPELFLRMSGRHVMTRPIKGTRPRAVDPTLDAQLTFELQTSAKEVAELVMITDLLRNDLGRVCEYGSVHVPDLLRLERFAQVQHLVSTVAGELRPEVTHLGALESCFPGGSITGAPKLRAMEVIDELEPVARGPYTGCAGYLGFNQESQLNLLIRTSVIQGDCAWYHAGAGIVADSDPEAEHHETMVKARAFLETTSLVEAGRAA